MEQFLRTLPLIPTLEDLCSDAFLRLVPDAWWCVVVDIRGSTAWIEQGRYRDVNFVGASSIAAVRNAAISPHVPFVFGGDGATFLVSERDREPVGRALLGVMETVRNTYQMDLHAGMVQVSELRALGTDVRIGRYRVSGQYDQMVLSGTGIARAEQAVKDASDPVVYRMEGLPASEPDFTGIRCGWDRVPATKGEVVSLVARAPDAEEYRRLIAHIALVYGAENDRHPLSARYLKPSFDADLLARIVTNTGSDGRAGRWHGRARTVVILLQQTMMYVMLVLRRVLGLPSPIAKLPELVTSCSDVCKFDGTLRMVFSGSPQQRLQLVAYLRERENRGVLCYGLHVSDAAIVTCLVEKMFGDQVHFVDGAQGGYAMAAKQFKSCISRSAAA